MEVNYRLPADTWYDPFFEEESFILPLQTFQGSYCALVELPKSKFEALIQGRTLNNSQKKELAHCVGFIGDIAVALISTDLQNVLGLNLHYFLCEDIRADERTVIPSKCYKYMEVLMYYGEVVMGGEEIEGDFYIRGANGDAHNPKGVFFPDQSKLIYAHLCLYLDNIKAQTY